MRIELCAGAAPREATASRPPGWSLLAVLLLPVLLLGGCWFPVERGQRLEQRVERIEAEGPIRQGDASRGPTQEETQRIEARLAALQSKLDELRATPREPGPAARAREEKLDKLAAEVSRLRAAVDGEAHRLDSVEKRVAELHATSSGGAPARKPAAVALPEAPRKPVAPEIPQAKTGVLALAREQEVKGQKEVAQDLYREYVAKYPDAPDAAQAHFRLGELAFGARRYQDAIVEFGKVASDFPRSQEAPDALLRTAESMIRLDLKDDAATVLAGIPKRYPSSPAAARAKERLAEISGATDSQRRKRR